MPLLLLILELAEIHDSANRRPLVGSHFDEVEPDFAGKLKRFGRGNHAEHLSLVIDDADRTEADLFVDPLLCLRRGVVWTHPRRWFPSGLANRRGPVTFPVRNVTDVTSQRSSVKNWADSRRY